MYASIIPADAQVNFKNASKANIKVSSIDGLNSVDVWVGRTVSIPFLKENNGVISAKISHSTYKPGASYIYIDDGVMTFSVKDGVATFSSPGQKQASQTIPKGEDKKSKSAGDIVPIKAQPAQPTNSDLESPFKNEQATFVIKNCCEKTITGYSGLLDGMCLKPDSTTSKEVTAFTGLIQSAIGYDNDSDTTATGANQKFAVLYKSIPEGLDTLFIYSKNLVLVNTGELVTKVFKNKTGLAYLITNSPSTNSKKKSDRTIAPNYHRKIKLYLGWNVLTLQYLDEEGLPRQAALLFMVTKDQGTVTLTKKSGTGVSVSDRDLKIQ